jgi:hypothetical protein
VETRFPKKIESWHARPYLPELERRAVRMESTIGLYKTELIKPRDPWKNLCWVELATAPDDSIDIRTRVCAVRSPTSYL